jgi:quercetin dioxygenase-like cupin family protein
MFLLPSRVNQEEMKMGAAIAQREAFAMRNGEGRLIDVLDNDITIKISSQDTGGEFTVFEGRTPPQGGPPMHIHHEQDEWWYVLEGEFRFSVDGEEILGQAGDTVFAPRGSRHTFQCISQEAGRVLTTVVPGGLDVFFVEISAAVPRGTTPDPTKVGPIFAKHGLALVGPPLGPYGV